MQEHHHTDDFSLKSLSSGLGFYEKKSFANRNKNDTIDHTMVPWPNDLAPKDLNLDDNKVYERLLFILEKPWLGDTNIEENSPPSQDASDDSKLMAKESDISTNLLKRKSELSFVSGEKSLRNWSHHQIRAEEPIESLSTNVHADFFSMKSLCIDGMIVGILFFSPIAMFSTVSTVSLWNLLIPIWFKILLAFLCFGQIYCLLCRLFCFETFGESYTSRRLWLRSKIQRSPYPFLMCWRFMLSCITGFISIPLLSLIVKRDLFFYLTGMYFQKSHES